MTKQEYLFLKLISNSGWFDWINVDYTTTEFHRWQQQGFVESARDFHYDVRVKAGLSVSDWRLTQQAHNLLGVSNEAEG